MEYSTPQGKIEIRQNGSQSTIFGEFPYNSTAVISDRGRVRKERFTSRAFSFAVGENRDVELLFGHRFDQVVAAIRNGTLELDDTNEALYFRAELPPEANRTQLQQDIFNVLDQGLVGGVSPGFRVPPAGVVPDAVRIVPEVGNPGVAVREINQAVLFELSLVTRPAYKESAAELRRLPETEAHEQTLVERGVFLHRLVL